MRQVLVHICDTPPQLSPLSILCYLNPYLSVIALESTVDKEKRKPTLYWSVGDSEQIPLEFLRSLDTVVIAFKDNEKVEDLVFGLLAELPQAKRVSPGKIGWNRMISSNTQQLELRRSLPSQSLEI